VIALVEPRTRKSLEAGSLTELQPRQRLILGAEAPATVSGPARLDLGEREGAPVERDQVDLAVARSDIACHNHEAQAPEVGDREILAERPQRTTPISWGGCSGWRGALRSHTPDHKAKNVT